MAENQDDILVPSNAQRGDAVPVSAFVGAEDGTFPLGAAALEKRALALQKMNQAGMAEMMIKIMPEVAAAVAQPLSSIGSVSIYDAGGNGSEGGVSRVSAQMPVVIRQVFDTMSEATGVDMREIMRASTYDATVNRNVHVEAEGLVSDSTPAQAEDEANEA